MPSIIAGIILAAGRSSRFGGDKMLHPMPGGASVIETTVDQYLKVFEQLTVVVTSANSHRLLGNPHIKLINLDDSSEGLSGSIRAGLNENMECDGWLIALGDMPYIQVASIEALRTRITKNNIVLPTLAGRQGNPVGFGRAFRDQLMCLKGDKGAKSVLQENAASVLAIPTLDKGVVHDIDVPRDVL